MRVEEEADSLFPDSQMFGNKMRAVSAMRMTPQQEKPYQYRQILTNSTPRQNQESFGAEHIAIEDDPHLANKSIIDFFDDE